MSIEADYLLSQLQRDELFDVYPETRLVYNTSVFNRLPIQVLVDHRSYCRCEEDGVVHSENAMRWYPEAHSNNGSRREEFDYNKYPFEI